PGIYTNDAKLSSSNTTSKVELSTTTFGRTDNRPSTRSRSRDYTILAVDTENNFVHLDKDICTRGNSVWSLHGEPAQVQAIASDVAQVTDRLLCPGHGIEQDSFVTHINDIHSELIDLWTSRWNTSTRLSNEELTRIANFVQGYIPKGHFPCEPICGTTPSRSTAHTLLKEPTDLHSQMHPGHKQQLVNWLNSLEDGQTTWPKQLLQGTVSCIAKTANPKAADSYRPIVIYSLIYRTSAAIRSKTILKGVSHLIHDTYGFMPEKEAMQYVFAMQALVELSAQADHSADGLCGFAVDLQRCFNNLRREPVALIAKALGISDKVLNPWLDFLHNNQRRFVVRGSLSSPIGSSVGFPEGCPLSVAAMTMINLSYHLYMQAFAPSTLAYSYVDNLAATAYSPAMLAREWCALESFCNMFALPIDYNKSFVWAASATDRKSLQPFPCRTVRNARDLGGCMTYGSSLRNAGLVDRCRGLSGKWQALRRAPGKPECCGHVSGREPYTGSSLASWVNSTSGGFDQQP
ncbi:unnamed protein product, partial [Effrenium voratum]